MNGEAKYHRVVLRRSNKVDRCWQDVPGWPDLPIDFGWYYREQLNETIQKLLASYPDHRMVRHFAISFEELNNGLTRKIAQHPTGE